MYRGAFLLTAALLIGVSAPATVGAQGVEGNWKFLYVTNGNFEQALAIVNLKTEGGKTTGELVNARLLKPTLKSVTNFGDHA